VHYYLRLNSATDCLPSLVIESSHQTFGLLYQTPCYYNDWIFILHTYIMYRQYIEFIHTGSAFRIYVYKNSGYHEYTHSFWSIF